MDDIYFPPRELEVMSVLWRLGSATVADVRDALEEELAYTSVLSALQTLEEKGYVRHETEGRAYRYFATVGADRAGNRQRIGQHDDVEAVRPDIKVPQHDQRGERPQAAERRDGDAAPAAARRRRTAANGCARRYHAYRRCAHRWTIESAT